MRPRSGGPAAAPAADRTGPERPAAGHAADFAAAGEPCSRPRADPQIGALSTLVAVDAAAKRHDISPLIYGVAFAAKPQLQALNAPLVSQQTGPGLADFRTVLPKSLRRVFSDNASPNTQALRNRATRLLWDPRYGSPAGGARSTNTALIPQLKSRLKSYPAGTKAGLINYSWGAENSIGGATAQADIFGILGREGVDLAPVGHAGCQRRRSRPCRCIATTTAETALLAR